MALPEAKIARSQTSDNIPTKIQPYTTTMRELHRENHMALVRLWYMIKLLVKESFLHIVVSLSSNFGPTAPVAKAVPPRF